MKLSHETNMSDHGIRRHRVVSLSYVASGDIDACLKDHAGHVACVVGFGSKPIAGNRAGLPVLWLDIPVLGSDLAYEVWTSGKPVVHYHDGVISGAGNDDVFFGSLSFQVGSTDDLNEVAFSAFSAIFEFLQQSKHSHLIRVWNYFPEINATKQEMERYRGFSKGRHEAFRRYQRKVEESPAACALGSHGGPLAIYFMASRTPGLQIENPRQISAYNYPEQYGPRSPTFSRATLAFQGASQTLFVSGTASIIGHQTVHPDSVEMQTQETLANIRAVIDQAVASGFPPPDFARDLLLKVYIRHAHDLDEVKDVINKEFGPVLEMLILQADICRADLLLEIEAVCWSRAR